MRPPRDASSQRFMGSIPWRHRKGFTLIELTIVVAIIAILVTLVVLSLKEVQGTSHIANCQSNLRTVGVALRDFAFAHGNKLPGVAQAEDGRDWQKSWIGNEVWTGTDAPGTLLPFIDGEKRAAKLYRCPGLAKGKLGAGTGSNGMFDYCGVSIMSGADLHRVEPKARMRDPKEGIWKEAWTPLIVEEDPATNNTYDPSPVYHGTDRMGTWHTDFVSNYYSADGAVHQVNFTSVQGAGAAGDWKVRLPNGDEVGILDAGQVTFGWFNKPRD